MKVKPEHIKVLKDSIDAYFAQLKNECGHDMNWFVRKYEHGRIINAEHVKDINIRFAWDILRAANLTPFVTDTLYTYCNDSHVTTALRSFLPKLTKRY